MSTGSLNRVLQHLRRASAALDPTAVASDGALLEAFLAERDEAAFEALVQRHGPMVLAVCKRILNREQDAEDAFQATFLVLIRKCGTIHPRGMVGNWLYGVACRVALKLRSQAGRRREQSVGEVEEPRSGTAAIWHDLRPVLDEELSRLPDKYRLPVVLCDLEGRSHQEAALQLAWPIGTVSGRLSRARALLARRLQRHGFMLSAVGVTVLLGEHAVPASLSMGLYASTVQASLQLAAQPAALSSLISARVASLMEGAIHGMFISKVKSITFALVTVVLFGGGVATLAAQPAPIQEEIHLDPETGMEVTRDSLAYPVSLPRLLFSLRYDGIIFGPILLTEIGLLLVLTFLLGRELRLNRAVPAQFVKEALIAARKEGAGGLLMLCKLDGSLVSEALRVALESAPDGGADARAAAQSRIDWLNAPNDRKLTYVAALGVLAPLVAVLSVLYGILILSLHISGSGARVSAQFLADGAVPALIVLIHGFLLALVAWAVHLNFKVRFKSITAATRKTVDDVLAALSSRN